MIKKLNALIMMFLLVVCTVKVNAAEKVLLDSDMVDLFDDGIAMMMLVKSSDIELLGITTVTGNTWSEDGTASAIRQLEALNIDNIPVIQGVTPKNIKKRLNNIQAENQKFGSGFNGEYNGAGGYAEPSDWHTAYVNKYGTEPTLKPLTENAVDFIIKTVKANPHEVTIF